MAPLEATLLQVQQASTSTIAQQATVTLRAMIVVLWFWKLRLSGHVVTLYTATQDCNVARENKWSANTLADQPFERRLLGGRTLHHAAQCSDG